MVEEKGTVPPTLVEVIRSPFYAVKRGETGEVVGRLYVGTRMEVWRVRFQRGKGYEDWHFKPYDLKTIEN